MSNGIYKYTPQVQLKILACLWRDKFAYTLYKQTVQPQFFTKSEHIDICRIIFDYYDEYNVPPTKDALIEEVTHMCLSSPKKKELLIDYVEAINFMSEIPLDDIDYIKGKIIAFGKRQALVNAVIESADILEKKPDTEYSKIEGLVKDAMRVGEEVEDLGTNFFENIYERFQQYAKGDDVIERIPTSMEKLDDCLKGGIGRTEMCVVIAPPGRGKTTMLTNIASSALENGYKVLHVSLENNENQVIRNYDSRILRRSFHYLQDNSLACINASEYTKKLYHNNLQTKKFPTKSLTVAQLRAYMDKLSVVYDFKPDLLVVDYGMIMKPVHNYNDKRNGIEEIYEELRAVADDYNCALITAAQGNRGSLSKKIVTTADLAECFAIANTADICLALCQTAQEKEQQIMRGFLAKNRDSADGIIFKGTIDYETKVITFTETVDIDEQEEEPKKTTKGKKKKSEYDEDDGDWDNG